jgi:hypothetical protein
VRALIAVMSIISMSTHKRAARAPYASDRGLVGKSLPRAAAELPFRVAMWQLPSAPAAAHRNPKAQTQAGATCQEGEDKDFFGVGKGPPLVMQKARVIAQRRGISRDSRHAPRAPALPAGLLPVLVSTC